ncbi:MAG: hypothetical protein JW724_04900 [Candidatus Altiarchaeota archaeon]|nr:hypothetical protein [Candidatus Altiarchaeota archaeon]
MKERFSTVLFLVAVLLLAGCAEKGDNGSVGVSAEYVRDRILVAEPADSYVMDMSIKASSSDALSSLMEMNARIEVDAKDKRMHSVIETGILGMTRKTEEYLIDEAEYIYVEGQGWFRMEAGKDPWDEGDYVQSQKMLIEGADVKLLGGEEVNGVDCYVLEFVLDAEDIKSIYGGQAAGVSSYSVEKLAENVKDLKFTEWAGKETFLPAKTVTLLELEDSKENMSMEITVYYSGYGSDLSIGLPDDALDAKDLSEWSGQGLSAAA